MADPTTATHDRVEIDALRHRHLLGLATYGADEIRLILRTAREFRDVLDRPIKRVPSLRGVTVVNLFFESSTRTRLSFELAEKRLSADVVNFSASGSSVSKGETLKDTARNIEAMKIDMVVIRHASPGAAHFLTRCIDSVVLNAGDGAHEHPTQALLDLLTLADLDLPRFPPSSSTAATSPG
jgi:aspartate carbamoyltransferase catalytic subunit